MHLFTRPGRQHIVSWFGLAAVALLVFTRVVGDLQPMSAAPVSAATVTPAYPLKLSTNGRYLVDQANQPVFWSGDAGWSLIVQGTNADIDYYLSDRQAKGFAVVVMNLIDAKFESNPPRNINGDLPFTGGAFTTPNEAYFAHADYAVASAAHKGMAVLLDPLYLGYDCGDEGWCAQVQAASDADMQSWGEYVGTRYKAFDNIVWQVGGDVDPTRYPGVPEKVSAFVAGLQAADARHLITAHNGRGDMAITPWPGATWLTLNNIYTTYEQTYQEAQTAYEILPTKPFFQVEGYYENEHAMTTQQLRAQAYWTVLAGGMGYVFGNCPTWGMGAPAASFCPGANSDWKVQLESAGSTSMQHASELFAPRAWQDLVPDWNHSILTGGYGTFGQTDYVTAGGTPDGSLVLGYLPTSRTVTVDLTQLSGPMTARWYDPSDGAYTTVASSPFANSGSQDFTPSGTNSTGDSDWVLVLEASPSPPPTPTAIPTPRVTATPNPTASPAGTPTPGAASGVAARYDFNEGTGTTVGDSSGNGLTGTLHGATWSTAGRYGDALALNGSSSYVDLGRPATLASAGNMTWEAWVYVTANPANDAQIIALSNGSTGWELKTTPDAGARNFSVMVTGPDTANTERTSRGVVALDTWTHVAGVYNAATRSLDIYVDGVLDDGTLIGTVPVSQVTPAGVNVNVGRRSGGSGYYFAGTVDEVKVYDRVLAQSEIQADMNTP